MPSSTPPATASIISKMPAMSSAAKGTRASSPEVRSMIEWHQVAKIC